MKVEIQDTFLTKLEAQVEFIAKDKPGAARKFKNKILSQIKALPRFPFKHRKSIYFEDDNIRELIFQGYKVVFKVDQSENAIYVFGFIKEGRKPAER
jgi:plasmid stabilization system protein ParE